MEWKNKTKKTQPFWSFIFGLSLPLLVTIITFAKKAFFLCGKLCFTKYGKYEESFCRALLDRSIVASNFPSLKNKLYYPKGGNMGISQQATNPFTFEESNFTFEEMILRHP